MECGEEISKKRKAVINSVLIKIHALNFELKKYFIACSAVQLNTAWLRESLRIPSCKAFCQIPFSGEDISELGAKGTIILLQDSRLWIFCLIVMCTVSVIVVVHVFGLCLPFWTTQQIILSEQPYNMLGGVSKYAQRLQAGSMQEETIFISVLSKPWNLWSILSMIIELWTKWQVIYNRFSYMSSVNFFAMRLPLRKITLQRYLL